MIRTLVAGLGNMGVSHALAYHHDPAFEIAVLVNRSPPRLPAALGSYPLSTDFNDALTRYRPDLVAIATYSDSHAELAIAALEAGAHVFVEKPLATTAADARRVVECARRTGRKLTIGYILRHHPSWQRLIAEARALGGPYVFRLNLNQQSRGATWEVHKALMQSTPPIVDCGVHYVDVMLQIAGARAVEVRGMGLRLSDEIAPEMYNYGHFQVLFEDGSLGWYEAGWGPMISDTAFFVKDVISPRGAVSIRMPPDAKSDDIETHTRTAQLRLHRTDAPDQDISMAGEPGHQELCARQAAFVARAIAEDLDLSRHMDEAVQSLAICLAADESVRLGRPITLQEAPWAP